MFNSTTLSSFLQSVMEDAFPFSSTLIFSILPLLVCIFIYNIRRPSTNAIKASNGPQAGWALPIIGHLHHFGSHKPFHETLATMADKYGSAFTIKMGSNRFLVVRNREMARECFTVHDKVFASRPIVTASKLLGYDCAMFGFAPYGPYWREMRKIATIEILSNHKLDQLKHIRISEVEIAVKELYDLWSSQGCPKEGILVDMKQWFGNLCFNILMRMVAGKRYFGASSEVENNSEAQHVQKVIRDFIDLFGAPILSDTIPMLRWWDFKGYKKQMKKTAKKLDHLLNEWLEEHKQRRLLGEQAREEQDFMDVMLRILEQDPIPSFDTDTIIKSTSLEVTPYWWLYITWTLCLILNNPQVIKKAQDEIDTQIGRDRELKESDIKNLPYLQAIVKESLRLYPASRLISLLEALEDCTLSTGYHIPAGTQLIVNLWKIHHDGTVWEDPESFKPERFLSSHKDIDVRGQNYELLPFGSGRRSCPGLSLALQVMHLTMATLLHSFEMWTPSNEPVDMTESPGLTTAKANPLEVLLVPRLKFYVHGR